MWPASEVLADANFLSALRRSVAGRYAVFFKTGTKWMEPSVLRVPMATREMEGATRFGDLPSFGATRCIFTAVSPDESVYVTVDHGGMDVPCVDLQLP